MTISMFMLHSNLPMWQLMYMSQYFLIFLFGSLILDASIILLLIKYYQINMKKVVILRTIIMAWTLGFSGDFFSLIFLQLANKLIKGVEVYYIYQNSLSISVHIITVLISCILTFIMTQYLFKRVAVPKHLAFKMAMIISTLSGPWLFIVPTYTLN